MQRKRKQNLPFFRISVACKKCKNFRFFAKFRFNLFRKKMRKFRELENGKILQKVRKNNAKILQKINENCAKNTKISRTNMEF